MKRILFIILGVIAVVVLTLISFLLYFWVTEWSPKNIENVGRVDVECSPVDHDTLKIISWNIGYGGLGDNM
ncbi:MAG: hypothetical protein RR141_03995, partial [Rikenellaceae bacterium]